MNLNQLLVWQGVVTQLVGLGVRSWTAIRSVMQDAGVDDATIAGLEPKYDVLIADVRRSAGL